MTKTSFVAIALGVAISSSAFAENIKKSDVPKVVLEATASRYPEAEMTGFAREEENGRTIFEVQLKEPEARIEIDVSSEGKILTEERTISMKELPDAVRQGLSASRHSKAKVLKIEKVTESDKPEAPTYELLVQSEKRYELVFSSAGQLTKEEPKSGKDED